MDNKELLAKETYDTLCKSIDERNWHYTKDDEDLTVNFKVSGDDLGMDFKVHIDTGRQLVSLISRLPFTVPEKKRIETAIAVCAISCGLVDGSFDYNMEKGVVLFRQTDTFRDSVFSTSLFHDMISLSCAIVDAYNDKLLALGKGYIGVEEFIN